MTQLQLFPVPKAKPEAAYRLPWYYREQLRWGRSRGTGNRIRENYSPWQMKLWSWLEKRKALEHHPNFNHYYTAGQLHVGGHSSSCPQELIGVYLRRTYTMTWWNFRHRSCGRVKWETLDVHLRIYFREHYGFNFPGTRVRPLDAHFLFTCWYAQEKEPGTKRRSAA
jgi:hypothetical protein